MKKILISSMLVAALVGCGKAEPAQTTTTVKEVVAAENAQALAAEVTQLRKELAAKDVAAATEAAKYVDVDPALWSQIPDNQAQADASKAMAKEHIESGKAWDYLPSQHVQVDGYPVFDTVTCDFDALPNASLCEVNGNEAVDEYWVSLHTTVVDNRDFFRKDWICGRVCFDGAGNLVGSVSENMVAWVTAQCDWSVYTAPDCTTTRKKNH